MPLPSKAIIFTRCVRSKKFSDMQYELCESWCKKRNIEILLRKDIITSLVSMTTLLEMDEINDLNIMNNVLILFSSVDRMSITLEELYEEIEKYLKKGNHFYFITNRIYICRENFENQKEQISEIFDFLLKTRERFHYFRSTLVEKPRHDILCVKFIRAMYHHRNVRNSHVSEILKKLKPGLEDSEILANEQYCKKFWNIRSLICSVLNHHKIYYKENREWSRFNITKIIGPEVSRNRYFDQD